MMLSDDIRIFAEVMRERVAGQPVEFSAEAIDTFCSALECYATGAVELERELATLRRRVALGLVERDRRC